jgi:hypothetical protein
MGDTWKRSALLASALSCAPLSAGCLSSGVAGAAASSAAAAPVAVLLPLTLTFDAILLGLLGARASPPAAPSSLPGSGLAGWSDPDDWVADCRGPILCAEHQHFLCSGMPGDCDCACEVTPPACAPAIPEEATAIACEARPPPRVAVR